MSQSDIERLDALVEEVAALKRVIKESELQLHGEDGKSGVEQEACVAMSDMGKDKHKTSSGTAATLVEAARIVIDEERLKKALGADLWNKVTKRVLDKSALEDQMAQGVVDPVVVAQCSDEKPNKPYLRIGASKSQAPTIKKALAAKPQGRRTIRRG